LRRIVIALAGTVSGLLMLFSYHTSLAGAGTVASTPALGARTTTVPGAAGRSTTTGTRTVTGEVAQTEWGPVQVRLTVTADRIVAADAVQYPNGNGMDARINSYALPVLAREVLAAQNAGIDLVSGATVTSDGYVASLQSAIDRAHL